MHVQQFVYTLSCFVCFRENLLAILDYFICFVDIFVPIEV